MHVCPWALGCLHQWLLLPHRPWWWCDRRSWWGDTMALRIGTGDRDIGGMAIGDRGPGDPVTITTAGTAGKWQRPCEGGCKMDAIRWLTLLVLLLGLSG